VIVTAVSFLKTYAAAAATMLALDLVWLGVVAKGLYAREIGTLLRPDVRWGAALLFYALYIAGIIVFAIAPAVEKRSMMRAITLGAFFGLVAYATFDLTSLALIRDFTVRVTVIDLIWGAVLTGTVAAAGYAVAD
jgi:uncharacterized membrane protein